MLWKQVDLGLNSGLLIINSAFLPSGKLLRFFPSLRKINVENTTQLELLKGLKITNQHIACAPSLAPMERSEWALLPGTGAICKPLPFRCVTIPLCVEVSAQTFSLARRLSSLLILEWRPLASIAEAKQWAEKGAKTLKNNSAFTQTKYSPCCCFSYHATYLKHLFPYNYHIHFLTHQMFFVT